MNKVEPPLAVQTDQLHQAEDEEQRVLIQVPEFASPSGTQRKLVKTHSRKIRQRSIMPRTKCNYVDHAAIFRKELGLPTHPRIGWIFGVGNHRNSSFVKVDRCCERPHLLFLRSRSHLLAEGH